MILVNFKPLHGFYEAFPDDIMSPDVNYLLTRTRRIKPSKYKLA